MYWGLIFDVEHCEDWPSLAKRQPIPEQLWSALARGRQPSVVGLGLVSAACLVLKAEVRFGRSGEKLSVSYRSSGEGNPQRTASSEPDNSGRMWRDHQGIHAAPLLALAEAMLLGRYPEVAEAWTGLLHAFFTCLSTMPPYRASQLQAASQQAACDEAMMHLSDCLYRNVRGAMDAGEILEGEGARLYPLVDLKDLYQSVTEPARVDPGSIKGHLMAMIQEGANALLVGPTGTLKTETVLEAAVESGCRLCVIDGRPELDERETFGDVVPFGKEACFVDGPVTEAFRLARKEKVVLLINELLRIDRVYRNNLVAMLDSYTPTQLQAMSLSPSHEGRHYVLRLRTGEKVVAPVTNLSVIATSNINDGGDGWEELSKALLGRFEVIIDMPALEREELTTFYATILNDLNLSRVLAQLEVFTRQHTYETNGILAAEANVRVMLALAAEYGRLLQAGHKPKDAFALAARWTLIPFCVPRTPAGRLVEEAEERLMLEVAKLAGAL